MSDIQSESISTETTILVQRPETITQTEPDISWKCNQCPKAFLSEANLLVHKRCHSWTYVPCPFCLRKFSTNHNLDVHIKSKHNNRPPTSPSATSNLKPFKAISLVKYKNKFICDYCGNDFLSKETLEKHFGFHATHDFRVIKCDICLMIFSNDEALDEHRQNHYYDRSECRLCNHVFANEIKLRTHMHRYHSVTSKKQPSRLKLPNGAKKAKTDDVQAEKPAYLCNVCGKSVTSAKSLRDHSRVHTGEKPFTCPNCDKAFLLKGTMKIHMRTHTAERPYSCDICDKTFNQRQNLKQHINYHHSTEKPKFVCTICNKGYLQKCYLVAHMKVHKSPSPKYSCGNCDAVFTRKNTFNQHLEQYCSRTEQGG